MNLISPETRMMGLPYGEEIMIVGRTIWTQSTSVTDGRTDGRTDKITITKTVQRIASHGKNLYSSVHRNVSQVCKNLNENLIAVWEKIPENFRWRGIFDSHCKYRQEWMCISQ